MTRNEAIEAVDKLLDRQFADFVDETYNYFVTMMNKAATSGLSYGKRIRKGCFRKDKRVC